MHISLILWSDLEASTTLISCRYAPVVDCFPGACPPADLALISFSPPIFAFLFSYGTPFSYMSTTHEPLSALGFSYMRSRERRFRASGESAGQPGRHRQIRHLCVATSGTGLRWNRPFWR